MNILVVLGSGASAVPYHRQIVPHKHLGDVGVVMGSMEQVVGYADKAHFDIVLYSVRLEVPPQMYLWLEYMKYRGSKIVLDVDDLYSDKTVLKAIKTVDAFLTPSPYLLKEYTRLNRRGYLIENGIDSSEGQWKPVERIGELAFGYFGSTRHEQDLVEANIQQKIKSAVDYSSVVECEVLGMAHWKNYASLYDEIDVSLAPLKDTKFNRCKSNLKILEAGFKKKAVICSPLFPYTYDEELAKHVTISKDFDSAMKGYTKERAVEEGEKLYEAVQRYEIKELNKKRLDIYDTIINLK